MKKVLLAGTALVGMALSTPALANLDLGLGGHFRAYGVYADHDNDFVDTAASANLRKFDLRRDAEVYFHGETTTDSGLTVGVQHEMSMENDGDADANDENESYMYFSGGWGRLNVGSEDAAAFLLQVAAPSADSNVDGLRTRIQSFNLGADFDVSGDIDADETLVIDYANSAFRDTDRLTYLTPKFNGFQAGVSYAPEAGQNGIGNNTAPMATDNDDDQYEDLWEVAARWDGEFSGFGLSVGGGYSSADLEATGGTTTDDYDAWDAGINVAFSGFSLGAAYTAEDTEILGVDVDSDIWVVGAGWDNGPYHAGLSYQNGDIEAGGVDVIEGVRWTGGGGYTYGPGMTFRGSVSSLKLDTVGAGGTDERATQVAIGTDVQF